MQKSEKKERVVAIMEYDDLIDVMGEEVMDLICPISDDMSEYYVPFYMSYQNFMDIDYSNLLWRKIIKNLNYDSAADALTWYLVHTCHIKDSMILIHVEY